MSDTTSFQRPQHQPSRRSVVKGAAWAVPAVAAATTVPAFAASGLKPPVFCPATGFFVDQQDSNSTLGSDSLAAQMSKSVWKFGGYDSKDICYSMHVELIPVDNSGNSIEGTAAARNFNRIQGRKFGFQRGIHLIGTRIVGPLGGAGRYLPLHFNNQTGVISADATFSVSSGDTAWGIAFSLMAPRILGGKTGPLYKSQLQLREIQCTSTGSVPAGDPVYLTEPCAPGTNDTVKMRIQGDGPRYDGVF